jgi:cytochrome c2
MSDVRDSRHAAKKWAAIASAASIAGAVGVWALASPNADPVTGVLSTARDEFRKAATFFPQEGSRRHAPMKWTHSVHRVVGGDSQQGRALIRNYGCGACHDIPGVTAAHGTVGPGLRNFAARSYIGGVLPNRPGNLIDWLVNPPLHNPRTVMPDMGITNSEARDMAAYLYTLRTK